MFSLNVIMKHFSLLATVCAVLLLAACTAETETTDAKTSPDDALRALFSASDEDSLQRNPFDAIHRGDLRHADRLGELITDKYYNGEREAATANLAALHAIDRAGLNPTNQIAYAVFELNQQETLNSLTPEILALTAVRPIDHFYGLHNYYPTFASGEGVAPFNTIEDYENNLLRHREYIAFIDRSIERFREGMASGVVDTKLTIRNVISQLDTQLAEGIKDSPFYNPVLNFPDTISTADRARLTEIYVSGTTEVFASYSRLRDFLREEYLPVAREGVGLVHMKGGSLLYAQLVRDSTTLDVTPEFLHELGLSEVARIITAMEAIKDEVEFTGTLQEFFEFIRTDDQFKPKSREWLTERYYEIGEKVEQRIAPLFSLLPKSSLEIRPYEPFREQFEAGGSYQNGAPDGSRPGVFYFNAYNLPERVTPTMTTLYLHEGAPGHHFEASLAQENTELPNFMRFEGNTAFSEGWALYAETLGFEMGMYDDPYQRFGTLNDEMLRAMRLVVDTGLHAKSWTREKSIAYMLANSGVPHVEATSEVERYIAIPSQALAYKVGSLTIQALRRQAEVALGDNFDIKDFHAQVLNTGSLPMSVLETKIYNWLEAEGGARPTGVDLMAVHASSD